MGKIADYKIVKTNIDPKFIGKRISLENVMHFTDGIVEPRKPRKPRQAPGGFKTFDTKLDKRLTLIEADVSDIKSVLKRNNLK